MQKETAINEGEEALILGWGIDEDLSRLLTDFNIITKPQLNIVDMVLPLRDNTTSGIIDFKKEEEFLNKLFFQV